MLETSLQQILSLCDTVPDQIRILFRFKMSEKHINEIGSKKEMVGHLSDSASVNLQRLIRGQIENAPRIIYDQNQWVNVQDYGNYDL